MHTIFCIITQLLTRLCQPLNSCRFFWFLPVQQAERRVVKLHIKEIPEERGDRMAYSVYYILKA